MPASASLLVDCRCTLGEGIVWWPQRQALLWTDIEESRLWMHRPDESVTRSWTLPDRLGCLAVCRSGRLLLGLAKGLYFADLDAPAADGRLEVAHVAELETGLRTRINDGRTDRAGNFVFGTCDDRAPERPIGGFYQYSPRRGLQRLDLEHVAIANSICFSTDGSTMYFCDSPRRQILQCKYEAERAAVSHIRVFADLTSGSGFPDGSIVDADGNLWNAEWGSALVRCYGPDGTRRREIAVPSRNPSCVVLGGRELDDLFVTTARKEMAPQDLLAMPESGGVYLAPAVGARGMPDVPFPDI